MITGAYSLCRQAIQLGLLPRFEIQHKSASLEGQIFIPRVNRMLLFGVVLLVLLFRTSGGLASAYGIAVTGTMVTTTALSFVVVWKRWGWPIWAAVLLVACFLSVDITFFAANLMKIIDGGWVPVLVGCSILVIMWTWVRGTHLLEEKTHRDSISIKDLIGMLERSVPMRMRGTAVFLTSDPAVAPSALMHNLKHNGVLHDRVIIVQVKTENMPRVSLQNRYEIEHLSADFIRVTLHFGFMESPHVPAALALLRKHGLKFDIMTTSFFLGRRTLKTAVHSIMPRWQDKLFVALSKQAANATDFFSIPSDRVVELGAQVTL